LEWKGGCAAHATFAGAAVYLKRNNVYCGFDSTTGAMSCPGPGGSKTEFEFLSHTKSCNRAKLAVVVNKGSPPKCHFDPTDTDTQVACSTSGNGDLVHLTEHPRAIGRTNKIKLKFLAPASPTVMQDWSMEKDSSKGPVDFSCAQGGIAGIRAKYEGKSKSRKWSHKCNQFPTIAGAMHQLKWPSEFQNTAGGALEIICPANEVIVGHQSQYDPAEDGQFKFACLALPKGMTELARGDWSSDWTTKGKDFTLECPGTDEVLVGLKSKPDAKDKSDRVWKSLCVRISVNPPKEHSFDVEYSRETPSAGSYTV